MFVDRIVQTVVGERVGGGKGLGAALMFIDGSVQSSIKLHSRGGWRTSLYMTASECNRGEKGGMWRGYNEAAASKAKYRVGEVEAEAREGRL